MAIRYPEILATVAPVQSCTWDERDAILYALCVGLGADPLDARELPFVFEHRQKVVPTFLTVLTWLAEPTFAQLGVDPVTALHGEQKIELHRQIKLPVTVEIRGRVLDVYDKGPGRGAVVITQHTIADQANGQLLATLTTSCFGRAEGGCGGSPQAAPKPHPIPERAPDATIDLATPPNLALLYRLTGDRNPIHADPNLAAAAGFNRPILHGLCGFGMTCHAVLKWFANLDPARIASHEARFASPVYPGDTLNIDMWRDENVVSFQARVRARGVVVINNGKTALIELASD